MSGRGIPRRWAFFLVLVLLLAGVGVVALCLLRDVGPPSTPSENTLTTDPCDSQRAADAVARFAAMQGALIDGTADGSGAPNEGAPDSPEPGPVTVTVAEEVVPLEPGCFIRGRVVYEDGTPYEETVESLEMLRVHVSAPGYQRVCEIDDEGRFACVGLDAGSYAVSIVDSLARQRVLCPGAKVEVRPDVASEEVVLVLGKEVPVTVHVLDEQSLTSVRDCSVAAQSMRAVAGVSGKTNAQGLCELSLIGGQYRIYVPRWREGRQIEIAGKVVLVKATDKVVTVELLLPPQDSAREMIRGVLVDAAGNLVDGYVTLEGATQEDSTEPASSFAIPAPDHQPPEGLLGYARDVSGELGRRFLWQKSDPNEKMKIVLEPCGSIVGRVVGTDRKPVSNTRLDLQTQMLDGSWRGEDASIDTPAIDSEGYFVFDGVPVGLRVKVTAFRGTLSGQSRRIELTPSETADAGRIVMAGQRPGSGIVQGCITDETGAPLADRSIRVRIGRSTQWLRTDAAGYLVMTEMPQDRPLTVTIEVDPYGTWSRTSTPDDFACDFQLCPQGWDVVGKEALPLFAGRWFNHAPMALEELRGRVVLLAFRNFDRDADPGLSRICDLQNEFGPQGLLIIAIYNHLPSGSPAAEDIVAGHLLSLFKGAPIAGLLDADPALVADLMPPERPAGASAGATHWMYQVHARPAFFLVDKAGTVRHCTDKDLELREWIGRLLDE